MLVRVRVHERSCAQAAGVRAHVQKLREARDCFFINDTIADDVFYTCFLIDHAKLSTPVTKVSTILRGSVSAVSGNVL